LEFRTEAHAMVGIKLTIFAAALMFLLDSGGEEGKPNILLFCLLSNHKLDFTLLFLLFYFFPFLFPNF
jgi:hypothetical protein